VVICLEQGTDLHTAQLMPPPLTASCFSKIQIVLPFRYRLTQVVPDIGPFKRVCVCVCLCVSWHRRAVKSEGKGKTGRERKEARRLATEENYEKCRAAPMASAGHCRPTCVLYGGVAVNDALAGGRKEAVRWSGILPWRH